MDKKFISFTKKIMVVIVAIALIDLQFPFVLAFLGKEQIAETLGGLIVTEIIGVFLVYCAKSFFETKEEEKIKYLRDKLKEMEDEDHEEL